MKKPIISAISLLSFAAGVSSYAYMLKKLIRLLSAASAGLIFLFPSCRVEHGPDLIVIDISKSRPVFESGALEESRLIQVSSEVSMGHIQKIQYAGGRFYWQDNDRHALHVTDTAGHWVKTIDKRGRGAEEYLELSDFFVNERDASLNLLSRPDKKHFKYSLDDFSLLGVARLPKMATSMYPRPGGYVLWMGNYSEDVRHPDNLWLTDELLKTEVSFLPIHPETESRYSMSSVAFSSLSDTVYYLDNYEQTVYAVSGRKCVPLWRFESRQEDLSVRRFQAVNGGFCLQVLCQGQYYLVFHDFHRQSTDVYSLEPCKGRYFHSFGEIVAMDAQGVYCLIDAWSLHRIWEGHDQYNDFESMFPAQIKRMREDFPEVDSAGNPFLAVYQWNL